MYKPHFNYTARFIIYRAVFFILSILIFFIGCARQVYKPTPIPSPKEPEIRVSLDDNFSLASLTFLNKYKLRSEEATYILDNSVGTFKITYNNNNELIFRSEKRWFSYKNPEKIEFIPVQSGLFKMNNQKYSGKLTFIRVNNGLVVINSLPLEEYLKGVVPYEIPCGSEDYYQAILSQAITARTYALYHIEHPSQSLFDVYSDTRDQVYAGLEREAKLANKAIHETNGIVLQDENNQIFETQYHSTCGGILELKEKNETNPNGNLKIDTILTSFNCETSPLYRWVEKIKARDLLENLREAEKISESEMEKWIDEGFTIQFTVLSRNNSGRIEKINITIEDKNIELSGWQVRKIFANKKNTPLPSNLLFFKSSPSDSTLAYIIGAGYGHGKGMCQWGAIGMSLKEIPYKEILSFYYPELKLAKIY